MGATQNAAERGTSAPLLIFQNGVFDAAAQKRGAETEEARAKLCEVDRATLYRYRTGRTVPLLPEGMRFATCVGLTVADLWRDTKAEAA